MDDKLKHKIAGTIIAFLFSFLKYYFTDSGILFSALIGLTVASIIGAAKELIYDLLLKKGTPTVMDFVATVFGSGVGSILFIMIFGLLATL